MPTIFESQELEDTVNNGDDDGECQKIRAGLQQGNLGREPVSTALSLCGTSFPRAIPYMSLRIPSRTW